jgi:putative flippase GtrA
MSQSPPQLDPPSAVAALLVLWLQVSQPVADIAAHYVVLIVAALIGGAWSLGQRPAQSWPRAMLFLMLVSGTAAMLTTGLATLLARWLPGELGGIAWLVAPVALCIGAIGHRWPDVGRWLIGRVGRKIDVRIDGDRS